MAKLCKWKWNIKRQGQKPLKNAVFFGVAKKFEDDTHTENYKHTHAFSLSVCYLLYGYLSRTNRIFFFIVFQVCLVRQVDV